MHGRCVIVCNKESKKKHSYLLENIMPHKLSSKRGGPRGNFRPRAHPIPNANGQERPQLNPVPVMNWNVRNPQFRPYIHGGQSHPIAFKSMTEQQSVGTRITKVRGDEDRQGFLPAQNQYEKKRNPETDTDSGDQDSIQEELGGSKVHAFPMRLYNFISSPDPSCIWMPCGKSWFITNIHMLAQAMMKHFPELCHPLNTMNLETITKSRVSQLLKEARNWGFEEKNFDNSDGKYYEHECFDKNQPNLCKYIRPKSVKRPLQAVDSDLISPPRMARRRMSKDIDHIFQENKSQQQKEDEDVIFIQSATVEKQSTPRKADGVSSPITPGFTLTNQVSPTTPHSNSSGRLQSNRGRSKSLSSPTRVSFPVSKRGRKVSSARDGRLNIPIQYDGPSPAHSLTPRRH